MSGSALRVVVADDHAPTRAAVREALESDGLVVVADVADAPAAVEAARRLSPDVCLLDIHMPGSGIVAAAEITHADRPVPVVMLTASADDEDVFDALRAGASGYLSKTTDVDRLGAALRGVLAGEAVLPGWLVQRMVAQLDGASGGRSLGRRRAEPARLTPREAEILELMREGLSTEEIGRRLFVAPVTVRTHIAAVLKKLQVPDREAAVRLAHARADLGAHDAARGRLPWRR